MERDITPKVLLNPRLPEVERTQIEQSLLKCQLENHFWLSTSGSMGKDPLQKKMVALSKEAILFSAQAVNEHLKSDSKDVWLNPLPEFHVGGLGIIARSRLSGAKVVDYQPIKWNAKQFYALLVQTKTTLTAIVPAQVYDLVTNKLEAPHHLRGVIVGGGALQESLYKSARQLGWNLLPSYGLTECASQVATADLSSLASYEYPALKILSHIDLKINSEGYICIKSPALMTTYAFVTPHKFELVNPKNDGWLVTQDLGVISNGYLQPLGRKDDFIKIGGESVSLNRLDQILEHSKLSLNVKIDVVLVPLEDERLGFVIHLAGATSNKDEIEILLQYFNQRVLPFERIRKAHLVAEIPRSELGKVLRAKLKMDLMDENGLYGQKWTH